jgi:hypothetical protein
MREWKPMTLLSRAALRARPSSKDGMMPIQSTGGAAHAPVTRASRSPPEPWGALQAFGWKGAIVHTATGDGGDAAHRRAPYHPLSRPVLAVERLARAC